MALVIPPGFLLPAAIVARDLKKQESNGSLPSLPQRKTARGNLPPQRIQPDTVGSRLLPPLSLHGFSLRPLAGLSSVNKRVDALGEGVSLEARLPCRKEAALRQRKDE